MSIQPLDHDCEHTMPAYKVEDSSGEAMLRVGVAAIDTGLVAFVEITPRQFNCQSASPLSIPAALKTDII